MQVKKAILNNNFIQELETELLTNPIAEKFTFETFKAHLWEMLCVLNQEPNYFKKLSKQIGLKYFKDNIGNYNTKF